MRRPFSLAVVAAILTAAPLAAQNGPCGPNGPKLPAAGGWASYRADSSDFKLLYLGHETGGERVEMAMTRTGRDGQVHPAVVQLVVPGYPYSMGQATEMVMQAEGRPAMKISGQMMQMMTSRIAQNQQGLTPDQCASLTVVGHESVTVPAGTFQTTHLHSATSNVDVWVDPAVPFGAVKVVSPGHTLVLVDKGMGGKTGIVGTPQEMSPGMMAPPSGGRRPN